MESIIFGSKRMQLYFHPVNGYLELIKYRDHICYVHSKLWSIQTAEGTLEISDMSSFSWERNADTLTLFWENDAGKIRVTVHIGASEELRFHILVDLKNNAINRVHFPVLEGLSFCEENYLLLTWQNGRLIKNPVDTLLCKGKEIPFWIGRGKHSFVSEYPAGLSFQFSSFYSPSLYGYYFAVEDADAYIKTFTHQYNAERHAMDFIITNYPENMGSTLSYCMPYDFVLNMFQGDWQVPANMYREWAIKQKWCKNRLADMKLPEKLLKTDLWRINHMNYALGTRTQEYLDTSVQLQDTLDCNLALHWYGWNMGQHDVNYPEYISAERRAEGWPEQLRQWNKKFDEAGVVKIPYINARLWEETTASWKAEDAYTSAIKDENGNLPDEPWHDYTCLRPLCPSTAMWQNKVTDMCKEYVVDGGFDGVYLDQIASFNATLCFDSKHPHPIGGGTWWNASYHAMLQNVRRLIGDHSIITSESCCETYIDAFNLFLILDTNFQHHGFNGVTEGWNEQSIPLFSMIYGDYALSYGSMCRFYDREDQFEFNFIRNILWGILPTIEGAEQSELDSSSAKNIFAIMKRGVDFYKENKNMILYGRLCEIPAYECDTLLLDWEVDGVGTFTDSFPAVSAVIWETCDGDKILFAYNYDNKDQVMCWNNEQLNIPAKSFYTFKIKK